MATDLLADELGTASALLERLDAQLGTGINSRSAGWLSVPDAWREFAATLEAAGYHPALIALALVLTTIAATGTTGLIARPVVRKLPPRPVLHAVAWFASAAIAILAVWGLLRWLVADSVLRGALLNCATTAAFASAICLPLISGRGAVFWRWRRDLAVAVAVAAAGLAVLASLRAWNAPYALRDLFATIAVSLPFTVLVAAAYIRHRALITTSLSFGRPLGSLRRRLAALWPWTVVVLVVLAFVFIQVGLTLGRPVRGGPLLLSLLLVLAGPHLDVLIEHRGRRAARTAGGEFRGALWRTLRVAAAAGILGILATLWLLPVLDTVRIPRGVVILKAAEIMLLVLVIAFCWNWVAILAGRFRTAPVGDPESGTALVGTRLSTVGPLLTGVAKATLLMLGMLTILVMLGINVWPLITGLSIFGLAI